MTSDLQIIDLFDDALRPPPEVLTLRELTGAAVLCVTLLVLASLWLQYQTSGLKSSHADLTQQLSDLAGANEQLVREQSAVTKDMLRAQLDALLRQREAQRELLLVAGDSPDAARGFSNYMSDLAKLHPKGLWLDGIELENLRLGTSASSETPNVASPLTDSVTEDFATDIKGGVADAVALNPSNQTSISQTGIAHMPKQAYARQKQRVRLQGKTLDPQLVPEFLEALALNSHFSGTRFDRFELASEDTGPHSFAVFSDEVSSDGGLR